jgi:hypothetical protein
MTGTMLCTSLALAPTPNRFLMSFERPSPAASSNSGESWNQYSDSRALLTGTLGNYQEFYKEIKLTLRAAAGSLHRLTVGHRPLRKPKS